MINETLYRSIDEPIRQQVTRAEEWHGPDMGLIKCWERGRELRLEHPDWSDRARAGELLLLPWRGGVLSKLKVDVAEGTWRYLAMWQGLRGVDLEINLGAPTFITCTRTGQEVRFTDDGQGPTEHRTGKTASASRPPLGCRGS